MTGFQNGSAGSSRDPSVARIDGFTRSFCKGRRGSAFESGADLGLGALFRAASAFALATGGKFHAIVDCGEVILRDCRDPALGTCIPGRDPVKL